MTFFILLNSEEELEADSTPISNLESIGRKC
jgi:hypothetical protein